MMRVLTQIALPMRTAQFVGLYHFMKLHELLQLGEAGEEVEYSVRLAEEDFSRRE